MSSLPAGRTSYSLSYKKQPIASYSAQQCVHAHQCFYLLILLYIILGLTQKNSFSHVIVNFLLIMMCYSTLSDLPAGPFKFILTQWQAVPYSFQTAEWGTAEATAYILKTYPRVWKKKIKQKINKNKSKGGKTDRQKVERAPWTQRRSKKILRPWNILKDSKRHTLEKKKTCWGKPTERNVKHCWYNLQTDHIFPNHRTKTGLKQRQRPYLRPWPS